MKNTFVIVSFYNIGSVLGVLDRCYIFLKGLLLSPYYWARYRGARSEDGEETSEGFLCPSPLQRRLANKGMTERENKPEM